MKFKKELDDQLRESTAKAAVHASDALIHVEDLFRLKKMNDDKSGTIQDLTSHFYNTTYTEIKQMETDANRKEYFEVRETARRLRGACLNLGARAMAELCLQIEKDFADWDDSHRNRSLKELENCFILSMNELWRVTKEFSL